MHRLRYTVLAILILVGFGALYGGYRFYDYVENDPHFCGSCHIMETA